MGRPNVPGVVAARPFPFPYRGRLDSCRTALLVIDMQVDFLSPAGYFARKGCDPAPLRAVIPAVRRLLAVARAAGLHVLHTRQGYRADRADITPYRAWRRTRAGLDEGEPALIRGTAGFEIVPELFPLPGEAVVDKTANGAFCGTDLDLILRAKDVNRLLFAGCTTDVCVHTTLREANDRFYECLLVEDACASGDAYAHAAAVHMVTVEDGVFGCVAEVAAVEAALALP